jgi:methylglutaconyl-CoA hydratase
LAVEAGVATITLARPEQRNALSAALVDGLGDHLAMAVADDDVRVVVLTNEGTTFCAGADLTSGRSDGHRYSLVDLLAMVLDSPKPVVGRIAGHCMGGGVGLAAACDISVITDEARVGFTEVRLGVAPAMISVVCLPKLRRADASELFLSGARITAGRAVEVGLLNRVVPAAGLDAEVAAVVADVVAGGPDALAAAKRLIAEVPGMDRARAFEETARLSAELFGSDEAREGMAAWRDKRPARWVPGA